MAKDTLTVDFETLERFMVNVFGGVGVPEEDTKTCSDVLVFARWLVPKFITNTLSRTKQVNP